MESSSSTTTQPQEGPQPRLCLRGCGFFGSRENDGLCSVCYLHQKTLRENNDSSKIKSPSETLVVVGEKESSKIESPQETLLVEEVMEENAGAPAARRRRCGSCNRKVGLLGFECRCEGIFCGMHRYPEAHACHFDFKTAGKALIQKQNQIFKSDKILDRI